MGSKLLGLCTRRDVDFFPDRTIKIKDVMTPLENLVVGTYPLHINEAFKILKVFKLSLFFFILSSFYSYYSY